MDPLTAFSLAASVIQVIDFSIKALGKFQQIYETGTTAADREADEISEHLGQYDDSWCTATQLSFIS